MLHALSYSYRHRKELKGDMRRLWIVRIGAAARANEISYSQFMHGLKASNVALDRKVLADIAINDPSAFSKLAVMAKTSIS